MEWTELPARFISSQSQLCFDFIAEAKHRLRYVLWHSYQFFSFVA
jgi:hypothetical protein